MRTQDFLMSQIVPALGLTRIAHATDLSAASHIAFQHALRLAVVARCRLDIVHVHDPDARETWDAFPRVRETLADWELLDSAARPEAIAADLGVQVAKIEIKHEDPTRGLSEFLLAHRPDLLVVTTRGRQGLARLVSGSVSHEIIDRACVPTLLIGPQARPFVDPETGQLRLGRVLMPVASAPSPARALAALISLLGPVGLKLEDVDAITVGLELPDMLAGDGRTVPVRELPGQTVETILRVANEAFCDLIVMPTTGKHGFLDKALGSTTERVVAVAPCPVLSLPLRGA